MTAPHTRAAARGAPKRVPDWVDGDDAVLIAMIREGRTLDEVCAALPSRSERQIIARVRVLRMRRRVPVDEADAVIHNRAPKGLAAGIPADPVKVARHWLRAGAPREDVAAQLRRACPMPHGWPPSAVEDVCERAGLAAIDVRRLLPAGRKLS